MLSVRFFAEFEQNGREKGCCGTGVAQGLKPNVERRKGPDEPRTLSKARKDLGRSKTRGTFQRVSFNF
jgi:hypothetical protein